VRLIYELLYFKIDQKSRCGLYTRKYDVVVVSVIIVVIVIGSWGTVVRIVTRLWAGCSKFYSWQGQKIFLSSLCPD
jgi:hypothetical protein